jgi:hypothetical protein
MLEGIQLLLVVAGFVFVSGGVLAVLGPRIPPAVPTAIPAAPPLDFESMGISSFSLPPGAFSHWSFSRDARGAP